MNGVTCFEATVRDVSFGKNVKIVEPVNMYECVIDDDVFVGPFVEIQAGVKVGARTKIQSHSFVCSLVTIGKDCFVGHGVMFINDKFSDGGPAGGDEEKWLHTKIGNNVSIGSNSTILPVSVCDNVVIGAGAVVTKNIVRPGTYVGCPATLIPS